MFAMSHNAKKKALSVAALSLCYTISEEVPRLRWEFDGGGGEARRRRGSRKKACETRISPLGLCFSRRFLHNGKEITFSQSGEHA
jgi:hypothetical protein